MKTYKQASFSILICLIISLMIFGCEQSDLSTSIDNESFESAELRSPGSALSFDGVDDYVVVPDDPSLDLTDGFTIAAWIYLESYTEWASIVTKGGLPADASDMNNYTIHQSGPLGGSVEGNLRFTGDAGFPLGLPESNTTIALNEWNFVATTFDGTTVKFYLNGVLDGQKDITGPLNPNNDPLHIGVDFPGGDEYWHGKIDELKIWNKALKAKHVSASMHGHATPKASALVGYWRFDEGSGTIAEDRSKHNNDGVLTGGPTWVSPGAP